MPLRHFQLCVCTYGIYNGWFRNLCDAKLVIFERVSSGLGLTRCILMVFCFYVETDLIGK